MNYQWLAEELAREEYKDLDDQAAADRLNAKTITTVRNIPIRELATWASQNGIMPGLFAAERDPATPAPLYGAIKTLLTILTPGLIDEWQIFSPSGEPTPAASGIMAGLMEAGLMTGEQAEELAQMGMTLTSRAAQLQLGAVTAGDVQRARVWEG